MQAFPGGQGIPFGKFPIGTTGTFADAVSVVQVNSASVFVDIAGAALILYSYTIPANTLARNGSFVFIACQWLHAANTNAVTCNLKLDGISGTTVLGFNSSASSAVIAMSGFLIRTGAGTQKFVGEARNGGAYVNIAQVLSTKDETADITFDVIGRCITQANDLSAEMAVYAVGG